MTDVERLAEILSQSRRAVFFGGAGMSTESGIPDFRSANGIYNQKLNQTFSPEEMASHNFFVKHPEEFFASIVSDSFTWTQNPTQVIWPWRSWSGAEIYRRSSLKISTGFIKSRARRSSMNFTARFGGATAFSAARSTAWISS